jgi:hypothetical protein
MVLLMVPGVACGGTTQPPSSSGGADGGTSGSAPASEASCASSAPECPAQCFSIEASGLDPVSGCLRRTAIGCWEGGAEGPSAPCFKRLDDGQLFVVPGAHVLGRPGWVQCSPAEEQRMQLSPC